MNKEHKLIWERFASTADYFEDAKANPMSYEIVLSKISDEDWEGNVRYYTHCTIFKLEVPDKYELITNPRECEEIISAFEELNPEGINDQR